MQDLFCIDPNKMHNKTLSDKVKQFKETEEGYGNKCELMENYIKEYVEEYAKEVAKETAKEIAVNIWNIGFFKDMQQIANITKLSLDEVKELLKDKPA